MIMPGCVVFGKGGAVTGPRSWVVLNSTQFSQGSVVHLGLWHYMSCVHSTQFDDCTDDLNIQADALNNKTLSRGWVPRVITTTSYWAPSGMHAYVPPLTTGCKTPLCSLARVQRFLQPTHTICGSLFCATPNSRQGAVRILLLWCHCHAILLTLNNTSANGCINSMYYFLSFSLIPCSARTGGLLLCAGRQFPNGYYSSCHRASSFSWGCAMMHSATSCIVSIVMHPSSPKQLCCINEIYTQGSN